MNKELKSQELMAITTKFGTIYVETTASSDGKFRVYDSEKRYLNYIEAETVADWTKKESLSEKEVIKNYYAELKNINDFVENNCVLCTKDWEEVASFMRNFCISDFSTEESLLENEWVNKIGDYYIVVEEN